MVLRLLDLLLRWHSVLAYLRRGRAQAQQVTANPADERQSNSYPLW